MDHERPSVLMDYTTPTFTPPRPPGRPSPIRVMSSCVLLLRSAVDIEVHGGSTEAGSVADHVTLRPSMCASRRQRAERGAKQNVSSPTPTCSLIGALSSRGVWPGRPPAPGLPRPCRRWRAAGGARGGAAASSAGTHAASYFSYPSLTSSSRVWGHGFPMASLQTLGWTHISVSAPRFGNMQAGRPIVCEHES